MDEEGISEFDVPLGLLPAVLPPGAGEGKGAAGLSDRALIGAGEEGEGVLVMAAFFGGDVDGNWWALAFEGELTDGVDFRDRRGLEIGCDGGEGDGIGAVGIELVWDAEASGADDAREAAEGIGEFVGVFETALEELVLGVAREGGDEFEVEFFGGSGGFEGIEMSVE